MKNDNQTNSLDNEAASLYVLGFMLSCFLVGAVTVSIAAL